MAAIFAGAMAFFVIGCSGQGASGDGQPTPTAGEFEQDPGTVLAELKASDGTDYSFIQTRTGDVVIAVRSDHPVDLADALDKTPSLAALYEKLSGQSAPDSLKLADQQLAEKKAKGELAPSALNQDTAPEFDMGKLASTPAAEDGIGRSTQLLTADQFEDKYCHPPAGWDFLYCWPNTGGNPWVQRTSWRFDGAMAATNCNTRFRFRYYDDGDWYTIVDTIASPGSHWHYYQYGSTRSRRFEILNNAGCGVRFAAWGYF
jgi:hypothetical protein